MAFIKTYDKWLAAKAFINFWLKDKTLYCNNCGSDYLICCRHPQIKLTQITQTVPTNDGDDIRTFIVTKCYNCGAVIEPCCENPQIADNRTHTFALIKQNREMTKIRKNRFASTTSKELRWGVSMPPRLYHCLDKYFRNQIKEGLFSKQDDLRQFMRKFRAFRIPENV